MANVVPTHDSADTMLHELGHGVYDLGIRADLPWLLRSTHLVATEASALLFGALAWRRDWLEQILGLSADEGAELEGRLLSARASELLVFTRWVLVMNTFERALYADPDGDLDALWWELVQRYQGVTPPDDRRAPDWAAKIHIAVSPVYYHTYLYGAIVALQLVAALESELGGIVDRPEAGTLLRQRLYAPGESIRWDRLVEQASGAPLSVEFLERAVAQRRRMTDVAPYVQEPTYEEEERKTSYLELFFDLVFVFAFTQVTALILEDTTPQGFARAALVLAMVWWAWSAYAWMTNAIDVENAVTRVIMFAAMAAGFFMALAVPDAFQDEAAWFAVAYFVVRVLNPALYAWGVRGDPVLLRAMGRLAPWFVVAAVVALVGGFVDADYRAWVWLASLVIDVVGTLTVARVEWRVSPSHFAERFALIVIIALGESIVAIGIGTSGLPRDTTYALSVIVAFAGVAALWWAYFDFTAVAAERALRRASPQARGPMARDVFTYFHYPVVLGIILYAVAAKKTLEHPLDPLSEAGRWALGLGIAIFLVGFALMRFRVVHRVAWERLAAAVLSLVVAVVLDGADAIATLGVVIVILVLSVALETARLREVRAEIRAG